MDDSFAPLRVSLLATLCLITAPLHAQDQKKEHPLIPAIKIAQQSVDTAEKLTDYTATFHKREVVGNQAVTHSMFVKQRMKPFSVYLRFNAPSEGREVIYVDGRNQGNLLAHETGIKGIVGTVSLHPKSKEAMSESKYPITDMGLGNMAKHIIQQWEFESKYGECDVKYYPNAKLGQLECKVIESSHPVPRKQFRYHITRLYIDKATNLPVRVEQYGFPPAAGAKPPLIEEYTYSKLEANVGLTDVDFDPRNPNYGF